MTNTTDTAVERGSGNVFADLGLPDPDGHLLKAERVGRIDDIVRERGHHRDRGRAPARSSRGATCRGCCAAISASIRSNACSAG